MSDHSALFHCPSQLSDDELSVARRRIRSSNLFPIEGAFIFGGAYYAVNQFIRRSFLRLHYLGGSIVAGYLFGTMILDYNYLENKRTFKAVFDTQTIRDEVFMSSPICEGGSDIIGAHESRWINYFLQNNLLVKSTYNPDDYSHLTARKARAY